MTGPRRNPGKMPRNTPVLLLAYLLLGAAIVSVRAGSRVPRASSAREPADLLLVNGVIYTGDVARPRVEAAAVCGERIVAIGTTEEMRKLTGPKTRVVDLHGRFAMPGFNDAHIHLASGGQAKLEVDLESARTIAEMQQRIRTRLAEYKPGEWITGRGWDHTLWPEKRFPMRADLDVVSERHPMLFDRVDGHVAVANSLALRLAGITRNTKDPPDGKIERDSGQEPTGMLEETAVGLVSGKIAPLSAAQRRHAIELALAEAARAGVTSMQVNSDNELFRYYDQAPIQAAVASGQTLAYHPDWQDFAIYQRLKEEGKLTARITAWLPFLASVEQLVELRRRGGTTDPWLRTGALKVFLDGAAGSRTAAMLAPYADDPSSSGILRGDPGRLKQMAIERDKAGFQLALHAIGDRANRIALDAFAAVRAANGPRDRRDRIEHAQVIAPEDFARFAKLDVIASMQPSHETTDMRWAEARLGPERSKGAYAWRSMLRDGVRLAFGTDYPVEPVNPMRGLYACVTRELPEGGPPGGWQPQEKISLDECIHAYTAGSAYAEFEEGKKGQILPGQFADIIVLSADVTRIPPREILKTEVLQTFVGGHLVYERKFQ